MVVAQQIAQATEEVGEVEAALGELRGAGPARERVGDGRGQTGEVRGVALAQGGDSGHEGLIASLQLLFAAASRVPVCLDAAGRRLVGLRKKAEERRREQVEVAGAGRLRQEPFASLDQVEGDDVAAVARVAAGGDAVVAQAVERLGQPQQVGSKVGRVRGAGNGIDVVALAEHAPRTGRQRVHVVELHAGAQQAREPAPRVGLTVVGFVCLAAGQLGQPLVPQAPAPNLGAQRVELLERRVDAGFDGKLPQQAPGKAVDRADGGIVERVERRLDDGRLP